MQLSPEQFHTLFDRAAQPVLLVQDGVITQCSSRAEGLIAPGSPIRELLPPDAVLQELIAAAPTVLPLRLRTGYVTAQVQPLEGALLLFLPVGDDDTCTSALSRAAQAVSAPLTTLLSASGTIFPLLADVEDPVLQRNLAVLSRSCYQLLRASENLGDLSAALRGRLPLSMEKTDLTDFLDDFSQTAGDLGQLRERVEFALRVLALRAPAEQGDVVEHGLGQIALADEVLIARVAVTLGHLVLRVAHDGGAVDIRRDLPAEGFVEQIVFGRGGEIFAAAHDVRDAHQMVVDDVGEVVGGKPVGF